MSEYVNEVSRFENALVLSTQKRKEIEKNLTDMQTDCFRLQTQNIVLETRLNERDYELKHLRHDYADLQTELMSLTRNGIQQNNPTD